MNDQDLDECARRIEYALSACTRAGVPEQVLDGLLDVLRLVVELREDCAEAS
jgi:hypothetical protein